MTLTQHVETKDNAMILSQGLSEIAHHYDGFIIDLWGVLHDGIKPYPGVIACLQNLKAQGKKLCLLSNSPGLSETGAQKLAGMGITRDMYDDILTSGQITHEFLKQRPDQNHKLLGDRCYYMVSPGHKEILDSLNIQIVDAMDQASFILNTMTLETGETIDHCDAVLQMGLTLKLPMLCANPDHQVNAGTDLLIAPGAIAARYEAMGGHVIYHGKPFDAVYQRCFELLGLSDKKRIAAIGDGLITDIAGANAAGIDSVFITGGIHARDTDSDPQKGVINHDKTEALIARSSHKPTYAMPCLYWE